MRVLNSETFFGAFENRTENLKHSEWMGLPDRGWVSMGRSHTGQICIIRRETGWYRGEAWVK